MKEIHEQGPQMAKQSGVEMRSEERTPRPLNGFDRRSLEGQFKLPNGVWVYYPTGWRLSQNRKDKLDEWTTFVSENFGQPVFAIYMNPDKANGERLWDMKLTFRHTRPEQPRKDG